MVNLAVHYNNFGVDILCRTGILEATQQAKSNDNHNKSRTENISNSNNKSNRSSNSSSSSNSISSLCLDSSSFCLDSSSFDTSCSGKDSSINSTSPRRGSSRNPNLLDDDVEGSSRRKRQKKGKDCQQQQQQQQKEAAETEAAEEAAAAEEIETTQRVDKALVHFQKALSLIVENTELHYHGNDLQYLPNDEDGYLRFEDEAMGKDLVQSVNPKDTGIKLKGGVGCDSNEYIYWKAVKIGNDDEENTTTSLDLSSSLSKEHDEEYENEPQDCTGEAEGQHHIISTATTAIATTTERGEDSKYENLAVSIFHSMICIYNIALCYQYKGMTLQQRHMEEHHQRMKMRMVQMDQYSNKKATTAAAKSKNSNNNPFAFGFSNSNSSNNNSSSDERTDPLFSSPNPCTSSSSSTSDQTSSNSRSNYSNSSSSSKSSTFYLNAAVDHYTQAYDLMTRFRLQDIVQYTFLMAMMNNLAATYGSLNQPTRVDVCNQYLVQSLILVICSSERDGHLGQEVLSFTDDKAILRRDEDRSTFESFVSNVMYLMLGHGGQDTTTDGTTTRRRRHSGETVAAAA